MTTDENGPSLPSDWGTIRNCRNGTVPLDLWSSKSLSPLHSSIRVRRDYFDSPSSLPVFSNNSKQKSTNRSYPVHNVFRKDSNPVRQGRENRNPLSKRNLLLKQKKQLSRPNLYRRHGIDPISPLLFFWGFWVTVQQGIQDLGRHQMEEIRWKISVNYKQTLQCTSQKFNIPPPILYLPRYGKTIVVFTKPYI